MRKILHKIETFKGSDKDKIILFNLLQTKLIKQSLKVPKNEILLILHDVAQMWNIKTNKLSTKDRSFEYKLPRQVAMYIIRKKYNDVSLQNIGRLFGKNHATVINAIKQIEIYQNGKDWETVRGVKYNVNEVNNLINKWTNGK